jgi:hypothetical protein
VGSEWAASGMRALEAFVVGTLTAAERLRLKLGAPLRVGRAPPLSSAEGRCADSAPVQTSWRKSTGRWRSSGATCCARTKKR